MNFMSTIEAAYAPLRSFLHECSLEGALIDVWQIAKRLSNQRIDAPAGAQTTSLEGLVMPWDLPTLAREVVLHASPNGLLRFDSPEVVGQVINGIRDIENEASKLRLGMGGGFNEEKLFSEMLRLAHRQFPWQQGNLQTGLIRYLKIFSDPAVAPMLERRTGLSIREFFFLGLALSGHLQYRFDINSDQGYGEFGISRERSMAFFGTLSMDFRDLRRVIESHCQVDANWDYMWNPLESTPLVYLDPGHPNRLYCPVPQLLLRRFSSGLYYDLVDEAGFGNAFGTAFENYVGEVLSVAFAKSACSIHKEESYHVAGKNLHHGPDWIVCDPGGNLFIECKTKRLTQAAKSASGEVELREDIEKIAQAIVQSYKNMLEAMQGKSTWQPNANPCWPLVITFEDWYFLGPMLRDLLADGVKSRLASNAMDESLLLTMPYSVMSAREFEICAGAIEEVGVTAFFRGKQDAEYRDVLWPEYSRERFPATKVINFHHAFESAWRSVLPEAAMPRSTD